ESVSSGVWGLDTNGNTTFINSSGARMLGYAPAELLGQPMHARVHHSCRLTTLRSSAVTPV
ncbi:MAG: PAS domain-containing protein, partial [Gallionella sp.]|nr:PAS domain-containing protein [Gallionella sp.]